MITQPNPSCGPSSPKRARRQSYGSTIYVAGYATKIIFLCSCNRSTGHSIFSLSPKSSAWNTTRNRSCPSDYASRLSAQDLDDLVSYLISSAKKSEPELAKEKMTSK